MEAKEIEIFYPESRSAWRKWLEENHISKQCVWLVFYNKAAAKPSVSWSDAVDAALCFGWIDSKKIATGGGKSHQFFVSEKPKARGQKSTRKKQHGSLAKD